jgi:tetratricopeptide (TPR) repeat protein
MTFTEAVRLWEAGRFEESLKAVNSLERRVPPLPKAKLRKVLFLKGDILHDLNLFRDAIKCYEQLIVDEPSDIAYANQGLAYWELNEFSDALKSYLKAVKFNPANAIAQLGVGEMYIKLGSPKKAIPFLEKAVLVKPACQEAYTALGIANFQTGAWGKAHGYLLKALELDPSDAQAKKGLALIEKEFEDD